MDIEESLTQLDTYIARYHGVKTPRWIGEQVGVPPERVIARAEEMKDEVDAISIDVQLHHFLTNLNQIAIDAQDAASNAVDARDKGGLYSAAVGAIRESMKQLNLFKKENETAIVQLNQKRLHELLRLFDVVIARGVEELALTHGLEEDELARVFQSKIVEAAKEIESR